MMYWSTIWPIKAGLMGLNRERERVVTIANATKVLYGVANLIRFLKVERLKRGFLVTKQKYLKSLSYLSDKAIYIK